MIFNICLENGYFHIATSFSYLTRGDYHQAFSYIPAVCYYASFCIVAHSTPQDELQFSQQSQNLEV